MCGVQFSLEMAGTVSDVVVVSAITAVTTADASGRDRTRAEPVEVDVGVLQGELLDLGWEVLGRRRVHHLDDVVMLVVLLLGWSVFLGGEGSRCGSRSVVHRSGSLVLGRSVDLVGLGLVMLLRRWWWRREGRNDLGSMVDWSGRSGLEGGSGMENWSLLEDRSRWVVGLGRRSVGWSRCRSVVDWRRWVVGRRSVRWRWWRSWS